MAVIWKFPLRVLKFTEIACGPGPVRLAALDPASGAPAVWIEHEPKQIERPEANPPDTPDLPDRGGVRRFIVIGTGHDIDPDWQHVGSMIDRSFVWHVFEVIEQCAA